MNITLQQPLDIVVSGFDRSGTSTQITGIINHFQEKYDANVKDFRGTENAVLFHTPHIQDIIKRHDLSQKHISWKTFLLDNNIPSTLKQEISFEYAKMMEGVESKDNSLKKANIDLKIGAIVDDNEYFTAIPLDFDVGVFEEPSKRSAGVDSRKTEQKMSSFKRSGTPREALDAHSVYRKSEFLQFRKPLREANKIIVRSRSEESTLAYQFFDEKVLENGISEEEFLSKAGISKYALVNPPTHAFIVCGPEDMTKEDLKKLYASREDGRVADDYEKDLDYQLMVNKRYASGFVEKMYEKFSKQFNTKKPEFIYLSLYDNIETINKKIGDNIERMVKEYSV
ncbi:MAG: hypothetical protein ACQESC_02595 [Nanobdellota archaeon]